MNRLLALQTLAAALWIAVASPAIAQERIGPDRYAIALPKEDLHPATPHAARRVLVHIEDAALAVCGATPSSLSEIRLAVRRSPCWKDAVAGAVARTRDVLLARGLSRSAPVLR